MGRKWIPKSENTMIPHTRYIPLVEVKRQFWCPGHKSSEPRGFVWTVSFTTEQRTISRPCRELSTIEFQLDGVTHRITACYSSSPCFDGDHRSFAASSAVFEGPRVSVSVPVDERPVTGNLAVFPRAFPFREIGPHIGNHKISA